VAALCDCSETGPRLPAIVEMRAGERERAREREREREREGEREGEREREREREYFRREAETSQRPPWVPATDRVVLSDTRPSEE
jgi:hypothetical protein